MKKSLNKLQAIDARCTELGLSWQQASQLAEADTPSDLMQVLGLNPTTLQPLKSKRWLWMAAQSSSVSYRHALTEKDLLTCLTKGEVPSDAAAPIGCFLDEVPMLLVVMAIEEAAQRTGIPISHLWQNLHQMALSWGSRRIK